MSTLADSERAVRIVAAESSDIMKAIAVAQANGEACETKIVRTGVDAMDVLLGDAFDLVIIDLAKPKLDGLRLIALIRATPKLRNLPVLAVASPLEPGSTLESLKAGASDYLTRPFEWTQLAMRVRQLAGPARY